jgi:MoaA/NifB/PqqE/SkfB family radical SAM enzyme
MLKKLKSKLIHLIFYYYNHFGSSLISLLSPIIREFPVVLHIRITSKCNLSCPFCYLKDGLNQKESGHLEIDEWQKILKNIPRTTVLDITGSEPFLAKDFIPFLKLVKKLKFKCSVTTNGTIFNNQILDEIIDSSISYILVSLDGLKDKHDELRGKNGAFDKSVEFIKSLRERDVKGSGPMVNVKTMLLDSNYDQVIDLIKLCEEEIKPDVLTINLPFQNEARGGLFLENDFDSEKFHSGNEFVIKKQKEIKKVLLDIDNIRNDVSFPIVLKPDFNQENLLNYISKPSSVVPKKCTLYKNNLTMYYDGSITPCDIGLRLSNIREINYDLKELYNLSKFKDFKRLKKHSFKVCEGCVFAR